MSDRICQVEKMKPSLKEKSTKLFHSHRDNRGRWAPEVKPAKCEKEYKCEVCKFITNNEWKFTRHLSTKKHLEKSDATQNVVTILEDEIEQFDKLANEREFLHESPCDIIMKDS